MSPVEEIYICPQLVPAAVNVIWLSAVPTAYNTPVPEIVSEFPVPNLSVAPGEIVKVPLVTSRSPQYLSPESVQGVSITPWYGLELLPSPCGWENIETVIKEKKIIFINFFMTTRFIQKQDKRTYILVAYNFR